MPTVASETLHALIRAVCTAGGSVGQEPALVADQLVEANLTGHDSHGVGLLPFYVECAAPRARWCRTGMPSSVSERGAVLAVEGQRGYGQVIGHEAMQIAMARAKEQGVALLGDPQQLPSRPHRPLGRAVRRARLRLDPLRQRHRPSAAAGDRTAAPRRGSARTRSAPPCRVRMAPWWCSTWRPARSRSARRGSRPTAACRRPRAACSTPTAGRPAIAGVMFQEPKGALVAMGEHKGSGLADPVRAAGRRADRRLDRPAGASDGGRHHQQHALGGDRPGRVRRPRAALARGRRAARLPQVGPAARRLRGGSGAGRARAAPAPRAPGRGHRDRRAQLGGHPGGGPGGRRGRTGEIEALLA